MLLNSSAMTQLLLCLTLGVSSAVFTFLTLDYMTADTRRPFVTAIFGTYLEREKGNSSSAENVPISNATTETAPSPSPLPPPRVLVWVLTQPVNHQTKAVHVRDTWGKRVDKLLFMSSTDDPSLPTVNLGGKEGRDQLWRKTRTAFKYVYDHHLNEYDWFMKADDDTFVVIENLRYMLSLYDPEDPIYFGSRFKNHNPLGYMDGGGGYVLSRAAVVKFVEEALPVHFVDDHIGEDIGMGIGLSNVGVILGDSRDNSGRGRFFHLTPEYHLMAGFNGKKDPFTELMYYPDKVGLECCSDTAISFHYVTPGKMWELNYLLYHLRPYGVHHEYPFPPHLPPDLKTVPNKTMEKYLQN